MKEKSFLNWSVLSIIFLYGVIPPLIFLTSSALGSKWLYTSIVVMIAGLITLAAKHVKNVFISLFLLTVSLPIDLNLFFTPSIYQRAVNGLPIHLADVFFIPLLMLWIFDILTSRNAEKIYFPPKLNLIFVGIIVMSFISILKSYDKTYAFFAWLLMLKCYLIFLYFLNNITTRKQLKIICLFFLLGASLHAVAAIAQKVTGGLGLAEFLGEADVMIMKTGTSSLSRIAGIMGHPNKLAMFLNLFIPLFLILPFCNISIIYKSVSLFLGFPLFLLAEYFTLSRSGFASLVLGLIPTLYLLSNKKHVPKFLAILTIISTLTLLCASVLLFPNSLQQRFTNEDYGALGTRIYLAEVALNIIQENPILGVGIDSYTGEMGKYDTTSIGITRSFPAPVHNTFLLIGAETGLISLLLFITFLLQIFKKLYLLANKSNRFTAYVSIGLTGGLISWAIHNQYDYANIYINYYLWIIFALIVAMSRLEEKSRIL